MDKIIRKHRWAILTTFLGIVLMCFIGSIFVEAAVQQGQMVEKKHAQLGSLLTIVSIIGGSILVTLSYVSYKIYKTEEKKRRNKV